jgi:putative phosphoribosyl transferase
MPALFADRADAARRLADRLAHEDLPKPRVVLALPRGGVPIGVAVARGLHAPLDLLLVRKIGAPWIPELAVAAVVESDPSDIVIDEQTAEATGADRDDIRRQAVSACAENRRRRLAYLQDRAPMDLRGVTAIVVDDGIATGTTARAALQAVRRRGASRVVLAVPVAPTRTLAALHDAADQIVCLAQPLPFDAVGQHYGSFPQVSDDEVIALLRDSAVAPASAGS